MNQVYSHKMEVDFDTVDLQEELNKICRKLSLKPVFSSARTQARLSSNYNPSFETTCTLTITDVNNEQHEIETMAYGRKQEVTEDLAAKRMIYKLTDLYPHALDTRYHERKQPYPESNLAHSDFV